MSHRDISWETIMTNAEKRSGGTFGATLPPINLHHASLRDANIIRYLIF